MVSDLDIGDICEKPEIAGPGFINLKIKSSFAADALLEINSDSSGRLAVEKTSKPKRIVVDFSGPNIAKQMHVGHLRSTIIGDCICRLLEFQGHTVIRQNHIGDWGTQFGMLCYYLRLFAHKASQQNCKKANHLHLVYLILVTWKSSIGKPKDFLTPMKSLLTGQENM